MNDNKRITGKYLNEHWDVRAKHALYHKDSSWYHVLERFPGALFDPNGYILFKTEAEYQNCTDLIIRQHTSVPDGIFSIPGYILVKDNGQFSRVLRTKEPAPVYGPKKSSGKSTKGKNKDVISNKKVSDLGEPEPSRVKTTTYRILRDTTLAKKIKALNNFECQICGLVIELKNDERYVEAHHIKPLGNPHNGPDIGGNIICVCPNHHAQLDYGAIRLEFSALNITNEHQISQEFINYHNEEIYQNK